MTSKLLRFGLGLPLSSILVSLFLITPAATENTCEQLTYVDVTDESVDPPPTLRIWLYASENACHADINKSGSVNFAELAILAGQFFSDCENGCSGDLNGDGDVNFADVAIVRSYFFQTCCLYGPA